MPKIGGIKYNSIVDGEGVRMTIFFSGCPHHCKGCHNEHLWDIDSGVGMSYSEICKQIVNNMPMIDGITLSGGDPFEQAEDAARIALFAKKNGLNVWVYTGFTKGQLEALSTRYEDVKILLNNVDVVVDGRFVEELKSYNIKYRGSTNQGIHKVEGGKFVKDLTAFYESEK